MRARFLLLAGVCAWSAPASAQDADVQALRAELGRARAQIEAQDVRLRSLEARLGPAATTPAPTTARTQQIDPTSSLPRTIASANPNPSTVTANATPVEQVGQAPKREDRPPEVAVLGDQGSIVTRKGQLTSEFQFDYARSDRNRAFFRGSSVADVILIGAFDINESRSDVLTSSVALRYGLTNKFEVGVRAPFVHRHDNEILAPVAGGSANGAAQTVDQGSGADNIGDVEITGRYQLLSAHGGWPFLIGNLQATAPTGTDPFSIPRDPSSGAQLRAATGAGFWGLSPSITAILPSDPAVLFGSVGYTKNFGRDVNTLIGNTRIVRVDPGDSLAFSAGIGVALNQRTTLNLGYAHNWIFGTFTRQLNADTNGKVTPLAATSRDLQLGRFLFGVTYRATERASINWSVEVGATRDATDLRTVLRIPIELITGLAKQAVSP